MVSGLPAAWGGAERQLGRAWLVRVRVWIIQKGHRAGRVWPELPQAEEGGKIGLLKAEWVC